MLMLHQLKPICDEDAGTEVSLKYFGQSYHLTAVGRAEDDEQTAHPTRFNNFVAVNELEEKLRYYTVIVSDDHLTELGTLDTLPLLFRANLRLQQLESLLITCIGFSRLNSALGGSRPTLRVSSQLTQVRARTEAAIKTLEKEVTVTNDSNSLRHRPSLTSTLPDLEELCTRLANSDVALWGEFSQSFEAPSAFVMNEIIRNSSAHRLTSDNYPKVLSLLKDVPKEAFESTPEQMIAFFGSRSGQAAASWREIFAFLEDKQELVDAPLEPDLEYIRDNFFAFRDLWAVTLSHKELVIAIICLIRYILLVEAPVLKVYSAKVCSLSLSFC